jgi:hypothetical protein
MGFLMFGLFGLFGLFGISVLAIPLMFSIMARCMLGFLQRVLPMGLFKSVLLYFYTLSHLRSSLG